MKLIRATIYSIVLLIIPMIALEAQDIDITGVSATKVTCDGYSDGTITVNVTGGSGLYNYLLLRETSLVESAGPLPDPSYTFTNLEEYGPYFIFVIDEASSEGDSAYDVGVAFVGGPGPITITSAVSSDISCNNVDDGKISVTAKGEYGNYIFELAGPVNPIQNNGSFTGLPEGDYVVTVTDFEGCPSYDESPVLTITNPPVITIYVDNITDVECFDAQTGSITISPSGGTPAGSGTGYSYSWSGPGFSSTSEDITSVGAGDYFVTVKDRNQCEADEGPLSINGPAQIVMAVDSITDVTCNGESDGAIAVTISGGTPGYSFRWTGPGGTLPSTEDLSGLQAGAYQLTVTDALGCEQIMAVVNVSEPAPITASMAAEDISCFGYGDGSVVLTVSGGSPPYIFEWTGPNGFISGLQNISELEAGDYSVTITDNNGCPMVISGIATINEPTEIEVTASSTDISCNGRADGSIAITVSGGTPSYLYSWTGPSGYTSPEKDIFELGAGIYSLDVEDSNECKASFAGLDTISEPNPINASYAYHLDPSCFGGSNGFIQINVSGGTLPLAFDWTDSDGITVSTVEDPTGLGAGTYSLTITDINGCTFTRANLATLDEPSPLVSVLTATHVTCFGGEDGTITVTSSGGTSPYEYSIAGDITDTYQSIPTFSSLGSGTFTVWTRDDNFCVISNDITLLQPDSIAIAAGTVSGSILCYGDSTVDITIGQVTGGTAPYSYSINGGIDYFPSPDFFNLPAGDYQTVVRDARGCPQLGELHQISQPPLLRIDDLQRTDVTSCFDALEGRILIFTEGGTGTITYTLDGTVSNTTGDFPDLPGGTHRVNIEDVNGCSLDTSVVILTPPMIVIDEIIITDVTGCFGDSNGTVRVTAEGGTPPLRFSLDGTNFNASGNFNGLEAGIYTLTVRDGSDCTLDTLITLAQPAPITIISQEVTQVTCSGADNGTITIVAAGGTAPLKYTLMPDGTTSANGIFTGLAPDIYTALVDDAEGCPPQASAAMIITEPSPLVIDSVVETEITCNGAGDGSIAIYGSGGVPPYNYSVDNQATWTPDSLISSLNPGTYEVFIRDSNLCVTLGGPVTISEPPALTLSVNTTDITSCSYDSTGIIEAIGAGGTGNLLYAVDGVNFQSSGTFGNLTAGTYTVTLMDETGCTTTRPATINAPEAITATITKTDAILGNLGSIAISGATGGSPPYEYTIEGPSGLFTTDTVYTDLNIGLYHVIVRDLIGCNYQEMVEIVDVPPLEVIVHVTQVTCFDASDGSIELVPQNAFGAVEYSIDSGLNFVTEPLFENLPGNTTYYLVVRDEEGKMFIGEATLIEPEEIVVTSGVTPAECNAYSATGAISISVSGGSGSYSFLWTDGSTEENRTGIVAGNYGLTTTDTNGCIRMDSFTVSGLITVVAYAGEDTTICYGGSIQLSGQGSHTPSWDPSPFLSDPAIANPIASHVTEETTFVLTITEETSPFGCYDKDSIHVSLYPNTGIEVNSDTLIMSGASIQLEAVGGPFFGYRWEPSSWLDNSTIPDPIATPENPIRYWVYATNEFGCEEVDSVFIDVVEDLKVYNVFSPNGDGINDYFEIDRAENFPDMRVEIYSRWGDLLYSTVGYDSGNMWDGTARGKEAPVGTYYYVIIPFSGARPITGNVTIIR